MERLCSTMHGIGVGDMDPRAKQYRRTMKLHGKPCEVMSGQAEASPLSDPPPLL